jgi:hypothetical protein
MSNKAQNDTHEVRAMYEFESGDPEYSTPLFSGTKDACDNAAKTMIVPGYSGDRRVRNTAAIVVPLSDQPSGKPE